MPTGQARCSEGAAGARRICVHQGEACSIALLCTAVCVLIAHALRHGWYRSVHAISLLLHQNKKGNTPSVKLDAIMVLCCIACLRDAISRCAHRTARPALSPHCKPRPKEMSPISIACASWQRCKESRRRNRLLSFYDAPRSIALCMSLRTSLHSHC